MQTDPIADLEQWLEKLEQSACFSDAVLAQQLGVLVSKSAISMPLLSGPVLDELAAAAGELSFRPARAQVGKPEARVYQELGYCGSVPVHHPLTHMASWFETRVKRALALMTEPPITSEYTINDIVCQEYRPGDLGITPHRDHVAYAQLVVLVVLCGQGRYCVCADRGGRDRTEVPSKPGWAILMPGPGFAGRTDRPFHMVGEFTEHRYSVGLRYDSRKSGKRGA